jgi:hypothetical protein
VGGPAYGVGAVGTPLAEGKVAIVDGFRLVLTVLVLLGIAVFILLFEKKRAKGIERDLKEMGDERRHGEGRPDD